MEFDSARPIWFQLVDEFRRRIAIGQWRPGQRIPSVRELALELGVNPNTVQRALGELDRLKLTKSERTAGRYVCADEDEVGQSTFELADGVTDAYIAQMRGLGLSLEQTIEHVRTHWSQGKEE